MNPTLRSAYARCASITRQTARNFYYAFVALPPARRRAIYALYAYCRLVDDAADLAPTAEQARAQFEMLEKELTACLAGSPQSPVFTALADTVQRYGIEEEHLRAVLEGTTQDLTVTRYQTFDELTQYCWQVAGAVGLLCLPVFGYESPKAPRYAEDLGLAMQLTNILRDIGEDMERGRIYLPLEEMHRYGISEEQLAAGVVDDRFRRFMQAQVERARSYFRSGRLLIPLVSPSSRPCPWALQEVYSRVLDQIEQAQYDVFSRRLGPSTSEKLSILLRAGWRCILPQPHPQ